MKFAAFAIVCLVVGGLWGIVPALSPITSTTPVATATWVPADDDCSLKDPDVTNDDTSNVSNMDWVKFAVVDGVTGKPTEGETCCTDLSTYAEKLNLIIYPQNGVINFEEALNDANPPPLIQAEQFVMIIDVFNSCGGFSSHQIPDAPSSISVTVAGFGPGTVDLSDPNGLDCDCTLTIVIYLEGYYEDPNPPHAMIQVPNDAPIATIKWGCKDGECDQAP